jgi:hypothetical protein
MRINDILLEGEERLDEKPMGFLSKIGNKIASPFSDKAKGRLETGDEANWLMGQFKKFLGATGQEAEPQVVVDFLNKNGYPTGAVEKILGTPTTSNKVGQAVGKGAVAVGKGAAAGAKGIAKGIGAVGGALAKGAAAVGKGAAELGKAAATGAAAGYKAQDPAQGPQAGANAPVAGQGTSTAKPAAQARPQGGGKVAGQLSQTPGAVAKRDARAAAKQPAAPAAQTPAAQTPATKSAQQPVTPKPAAGGVKVAGAKKRVKAKAGLQVASTQYEDYDVLLEKALSSSQLDSIFMTAVQDAIKRDAGGTKDTEGSGKASDASTKGFGSGVAQGAKDAMGGGKEPQLKTKSGKPATDANKDGKDDTTGEPVVAAPVAQQAAELPKNIKISLDKLTPQEKTELLGML